METYNPLVTIVIPVYNGTNFMREAIDCALSQTYKNIEVIVINDGSTDEGKTEAVAKSYGNKIRYIYKPNGGVSSALNLAISKMNGEWISWLSHDDLYYPNKIEKQIQFICNLMSQNPHLDLEKIVLHSATESIDKDGNVIKRPSYKDIPEVEKTIDVILNNIYNYRLSGCSFLIPAAAFHKIGGFREDIRTVSDVEFWYRLLFNGYQFYCLSNDVLVKNRSHGKQVGKTKVGLFEKELEELHIEIADRLSENKEFCTTSNFKKMYYGLVKRHIYVAAQYVKETYLKDKSNFIDYNVLIPICAMKWKILGTGRNALRYIYRKINVK